MIELAKRLDREVKKVYRDGNALILQSEAGTYRIEPVTERIIRIRYTLGADFFEGKRTALIYPEVLSDWSYRETAGSIVLSAKKVTLKISKSTASFSWFDEKGRILLRERPEESKELEEFDAFRVIHDGKTVVEKVETADGIKSMIREANRCFDKKLYRTRLHLVFQEDEAIYGFGQNDEGLLNLRGKKLYIHQANMKIAVPMMVSSKGYGILFDTYSPLIFSDMGEDAYIHTEADYEMDYYFICGDSMDGVVKGYRQLSGKAAMLPAWAFGYIQSQERYETQEEILSVAEGFRKRKLGLDCIVLDWQSWPGELWGQKTVDPERFPDLQKMTEALHRDHIRFMISVWPNMSEQCEHYREFQEQGLLIPGTNLYDPYREEGRALYWKQAKGGLFDYGVDAWWCDSSEPITPEWAHNVKPEAAAAYYEYFSEGCKQFDTAYMSAYGLYHAQAMYEGQRGVTEEKRVVNLTRSGCTGQQRFGTVLWSGDVSASWKTLQNQIPEGLNLSVSGLPYWTTDVGAFFVKKGKPWYWNGEYEEGNRDPAYRELYVRWLQFGCFCPVFRSHGTDIRREPWSFGEEGEMFYDAIKRTNELRYRLLPYLYSCVYRVWREDAAIMRMLAFDFPEDERARECKDQFLFGDRLMVCPVLHPMYYGRDGEALKEKSRAVYLPGQKGGWYDFYTGEHLEGGQEVMAEAPLDRIPLYVKAGTVLPLAEPAGSVEEMDWDTIILQVYPGEDADFCLYEDAGDGYGYESGEYVLTHIAWKEETGRLTIGESVREHVRMAENKRFSVMFARQRASLERRKTHEIQ